MNTTNCLELIEIYDSPHGSVFQCNKTNSYLLKYSGIVTAFKPSDFLNFIKQVNCVNIEELIYARSGGDTVLIMPPYCDRCFLLSLTDLLNLKDLLNSAKFNLQLCSMLNSRLQPMFCN